MDKTSLGDRMKMLEASTDARLLPQLPVIVRLDGRSFSKFTKGMKRPFDSELRAAMIETTKYLVENTHAKIGYTQSDEISLILYTDNVRAGSILFDGRVSKICSVFASLATGKFLLEMQKRFPEKVANYIPQFDARVFAAPTKVEAYNALLWRVLDASKNSVSMVASAYFSHNELMKLTTNERKDKLIKEKGINWNDFSDAEKQGVFVRREKFWKVLDKETLSKIPEDKQPADGKVQRSHIVEMDMPRFDKVSNPLDVIFNEASPEYKPRENRS